MISLTTAPRAALIREIKRLRSELSKKKQECANLSADLKKGQHHTGTKTGAEAERYVQNLFKKGVATHSHSDHDLLVGKCRIEIKASGCLSTSKGSSSKKWVWHKFRGSGGKKRYHLLVLVGAIDARYRSQYKSRNSDFVLFAIPYQGVASFSAAEQGGTMSLGTNREKLQTTSVLRRRMWDRYHVSPSGLRRMVKEINDTRDP
ncbi:hypothetical protein [Prosthecobacter vanneervenii]|uniref:Uncharacterized protein n=1 Tax=Prosthecobacter vanneervenii TaxID=48466 RepID=A0A7W7YEP9_9BACT|nr:hypothetical protein [Prosthecobacter vanneervenii]MBB5034840.1 hypothetical protein [Prosthecobacter vanneervenii]